MLYTLGRPFINCALSQYFGSITVKGEPLCEVGPVMVVSNHPNHVLDPLLVTKVYRRPLWYVAKSTLFTGGLKTWFLDSCHLVPVYRQQDPNESGEDLKEKNEETFRFVISTLRSGRAMAIFPEGTSWGERRLYPIKTGAARMAIRAEDESGFELGLLVQPIGITYSDLDQFRSSATVVIGVPIPVKEYESIFKTNPVEANRALTARIEDSIRGLSVDIKDSGTESLVEKIGKVYQSAGGVGDDLERLALVTKNVHALGPKFPAKRVDIERRIDSFLSLSSVFSIPGGAPLEMKEDHLFLALATPLVVIGAILHYLPYRLVGTLALKYSTHPVELGAYRFGFGVIFFSIWFLLIGLLTWWWTGSFLSGVVGFAVAATSAYFVNNYLPYVRLLLLSLLWPGRKDPLSMLRHLRDEIVTELESLRVE